MRVATSEKGIPYGNFYVKLDGYYIYDSKPIILEYLTDLFRQRKANVYILEYKGKFYVFEKKDAGLSIYTKESIDDILMIYPNAVVKETDYLKKIKPKTKGIKINKQQIAIFFVLVVALSGFIIYTKNSTNSNQQHLTNTQSSPVIQDQQQTQPACYSQVEDFLNNYVPYIQADNESLVVRINDTLYSKPLEKKPVNPLTELDIKITSASYNITRTEEGFNIRIDDYYKCLDFIYQNQNIPIIIRRLNYYENLQEHQSSENNSDNYSCLFIIPWDCIGTNATTNITTTATTGGAGVNPATTSNAK